MSRIKVNVYSLKPMYRYNPNLTHEHKLPPQPIKLFKLIMLGTSPSGDSAAQGALEKRPHICLVTTHSLK